MFLTMKKGEKNAERPLLALETASSGPLTLRMRSGLPGMASDNHDFGPALVTNLVDVLAASADDNGGVLGYDEAAHVDVRRRYGGCARGRGARG